MDKEPVKKTSENEEKKKSSSSSSSSSKKGKGYSSKAALVVALRNKFFFMMYRYATLVFITSIITFITSVSFFLFFSKQPVPPQYIPVNEDGTYMKLPSVADCNSKTESDVKTFALNAINKIYKYDYINYSDQFQDAALYFTTSGWNEYLDNYKASRTLLSLKENKWIVTAKPTGTPEFVKAPETVEGVCSWELKVPINISYVGNNSMDLRGELYLRINRISVIKSPEGLGIRKIIMRELN